MCVSVLVCVSVPSVGDRGEHVHGCSSYVPVQAWKYGVGGGSFDSMIVSQVSLRSCDQCACVCVCVISQLAP